MPDPKDKPAKGGIGETTSQRCIGCGEMYSQESASKHETCNYTMAQFAATPGAEADRTVVYPDSGVEKSNPQAEAPTKRKPGEPNWPDEVRAAAKDPKNLLNQYILVAQIGKGGMGTVWKAFDRSLLRWVAIKFLTSDGNEEGVLRFKREAQLAGGLRHPNIAPIYEVGEARGQHFIAMEFIDGSTMANAQLPMPETIDIFVKVAQGIEAAHKKGVIHRDLKPQNIMLTSDNWPYVMDFGLAKALRADSSLSVTGSVMGTPAYMPPEQAQGKLELIDHQSDVYSLGATMYAILSRKTPFQAESAMDILMKVCNEEPIPPRKHNPEIPPDVETIILKAMSKKKEDRYPSAGALAEDLKRFLGNEEIEATRPGFVTMVMRKARRHRSAFIAGGVAAVAVAVLLGVMLRPKEKNPLSGTGGGGGAVESPEVRAERDKWKREWQGMKDDLSFGDWKPGANPQLAEKANKHLELRMAALGDSIQVGNAVTDWFKGEVGTAKSFVAGIHGDQGKWTRNQADVKRALLWCDQMAILAKDIEELKRHLGTLQEIRTMATAITGWRGQCVLRIAVDPYAEVELKAGGKRLSLKESFTPLWITDLEVADYVLVLKHPEHGEHQVNLAGLEGGKAYQVSGKMIDKSTIKVTPK
jgi:predicted Ser/Thr protein kinase